MEVSLLDILGRHIRLYGGNLRSTMNFVFYYYNSFGKIRHHISQYNSICPEFVSRPIEASLDSFSSATHAG